MKELLFYIFISFWYQNNITKDHSFYWFGTLPCLVWRSVYWCWKTTIGQAWRGCFYPTGVHLIQGVATAPKLLNNRYPHLWGVRQGGQVCLCNKVSALSILWVQSGEMPTHPGTSSSQACPETLMENILKPFIDHNTLICETEF